MRFLLLLPVLLLTACPAVADDVTDRLDRARDFYQQGALAEAAGVLGAVAVDLQTRLGQELAHLMPEPPASWQGGEAQVVAMGALGGLTVSRDYQLDSATVDLAALVDSPAVAGVASLLGDPGVLGTQPGMRRVRVGERDALLRWEGSTRSGQIMLVLGQRAMLQAVGRDIAGPEVLVDFMKLWNVTEVAQRLGVPAVNSTGRPAEAGAPPSPAR